MKAIPILKDQVPRLWHEVKPLIDKAIVHNHGELIAEDVLESDNEDWRPDVDYLKDLVENWVFENHTGSLGLVEDYARAFVDQVNFHEILEHILEDIDNELKAREFLNTKENE